MANELRSRQLLRSLPRPYSTGSDSTKYLRDPRPADAEMAGERRPVFEPVRVEKCLRVAGEFERIAGLFRSRFGLRFGVRKSI